MPSTKKTPLEKYLHSPRVRTTIPWCKRRTCRYESAKVVVIFYRIPLLISQRILHIISSNAISSWRVDWRWIKLEAEARLGARLGASQARLKPISSHRMLPLLWRAISRTHSWMKIVLSTNKKIDRPRKIQDSLGHPTTPRHTMTTDDGRMELCGTEPDDAGWKATFC